ncbi:MAG TPA: EAL domain-containing protein, partial [Dehalococcoidia bacterium]
EALVRWQHPERGLTFPADFMPVAEETGMIVPLGEWVLRTACAQNAAWQAAGLPPIRIAVNLSARQFQHRDLVGMVSEALRESRLDSRYLQLEITESIAMEDAEFTGGTMTELHKMGVQVAIDDFGVGYSSLSYLKRFPISAVKIDQSFVRDLMTDSSDAAIASTIIAMAHALELSVIAEGVETEEQLTFLREQRCTEFQGYYCTKPLPADELEELLRRSALPGVTTDHQQDS